MSKTMETAMKMLESLPEEAQERVVEELRGLVEEARDDARWNQLFEQRKVGLVIAASKAREDAAAGKAQDMDYEKL